MNTIDLEKNNLVILGDSMASEYFQYSLKNESKGKFNLLIFSNGSCEFTYKDLVNCEDNIKLQNKISQINPDKILISRSWQNSEIMDFKKSIPYFKAYLMKVNNFCYF